MKWIPDEASEEAMEWALGRATAGRDGYGPRPGPGTRSGERQCRVKGGCGEKEKYDHGMIKWGIKRLSGKKRISRGSETSADLGKGEADTGFEGDVQPNACR